jgi:hypothetical protein
MRSLGTALGAGVLFLLVTACANPTSSVGAGSGSGPELSTSASAPPSSDPNGIAPGEPPPNGGTPVPAEKLDATTLPEDYPRSVWTEGDGGVIGVIGTEGGCSKASVEVIDREARRAAGRPEGPADLATRAEVTRSARCPATVPPVAGHHREFWPVDIALQPDRLLYRPHVMRNAKVIVALAVGLCALAGCGSGDGSSGSAASTPPSSSGSNVPTASGQPPGSATLPSSTVRPPGQSGVPEQPPQSSAPALPAPTEVPPARVDGSTLPETYKSQVAVANDGKTLQVIGQAGGCKTASAEITAQSGDQVLITLVTTYYAPSNGGVCTQELRDVPLNVTLDAPLADRRVVLEARQDSA